MHARDIKPPGSFQRAHAQQYSSAHRPKSTNHKSYKSPRYNRETSIHMHTTQQKSRTTHNLDNLQAVLPSKAYRRRYQPLPLQIPIICQDKDKTYTSPACEDLKSNKENRSDRSPPQRPQIMLFFEQQINLDLVSSSFFSLLVPTHLSAVSLYPTPTPPFLRTSPRPPQRVPHKRNRCRLLPKLARLRWNDPKWPLATTAFKRLALFICIRHAQHNNRSYAWCRH